MQSDNGRFLRKSSDSIISFSDGCLRIDGKTVIQKIENQFVLREDELYGRCTDSAEAAHERLATIAGLMNENRTLEALFIANAARWPFHEANGDEARKANFDPTEPRSHGEWADDGAASSASASPEDIQYRGYFHDFVLDDLINGLSSNGSILIKNVPVMGLNAVLAIPDGASLPKGSLLPYFIELKTGLDPKFTTNQQQVYPQICVGGHATSLDPRIRRLGLIPGVPFPPLKIMLVYTAGPGLPIKIHDYCKVIGLGF